jgi:hypothetical protein
MDSIRVCSVEGCERAAAIRGWCHRHYCRWKRHGDPLVVLPGGIKVHREPCIVDGCDRLGEVRGWCPRHYQRARKYGDPTIMHRAPMGTGTIDKDGYRSFCINGEKILEHRRVMAKVLGRPLRDDEDVHHLNHNRLDNRPENLMVLPHGQHSRIHNPITTKCCHGHVRTEENTYHGRRSQKCRDCARERDRKRRLRCRL